MVLRLIVFSVILLGVIGCSEPISMEEISGAYYIKNGTEGNLLTIKSNGKYAHQFLLPNNTLGIFEGEWTVDKELNGTLRITLSNFQFPPSRVRKKPIGFWSMIVEKERGHVILCFDLDIPTSDGCFIKRV